MSTFKKQLKTKILLGLLIIGILCIIPFIALKYGASGDGFLGYFGAIMGSAIGALVTPLKKSFFRINQHKIKYISQY